MKKDKVLLSIRHVEGHEEFANILVLLMIQVLGGRGETQKI